MNNAIGRPVLAMLLALLVGSNSFALGRVQTDGKEDNRESIRDEANRFIRLLRAATEDRESEVLLNQLSDLHLSSEQVQELITAAVNEDSEERRVVLWQAIRQSRDSRGRAYLMQTLVNDSTADLQIQFIEGLQNPTRHDVPILVAIYKSHRPRQKAEPVAQAPNAKLRKQDIAKSDSNDDRAWNNKSKEGYDNENRYNRNRSTNDLRKDGSERQSKADVTDETESKDVPNADELESDALEDESDMFDVPQRIVELACHTDWQDSLTFFGPLSKVGERVSEDVNAARLAVRSRKSEEAKLAQEQLLYWLLKNGFEDSHRISAFQKFRNFRTTGRSLKSYANLGEDLLLGLDNPESRAKAVPLITSYVEPTRFLSADEAEVVRLSGLEAMRAQIMECRKSPALANFSHKAIAYKPVLKHALGTDPSPAVKELAKQLLELIATYELEIP